MNKKIEKKDLVAAIGKGTLGAIPVVGPLVAEVVGTLIPNYRLDRIHRLLQKLEERLARVEESVFRAKFVEPEFVDLLEDGFVQASRALTEERLDYLSAVLKQNLTDDQVSYAESKRLLGLLGELSDVEVIILASHSLANHPQRNPAFWETHKDVLTPRPAYIGAPEEQINEATIYESYRQHLVQLGLISPRFQRPKQGTPEFDENTGMLKASGYRVTRLGQILLRRIEMATELRTS
jgi:hypothetical protein